MWQFDTHISGNELSDRLAIRHDGAMPVFPADPVAQSVESLRFCSHWKVQASCVIEAVQAQKLKLLCKRLFTIGAGVWSLGEFAEKQNQPGSPVE